MRKVLHIGLMTGLLVSAFLFRSTGAMAQETGKAVFQDEHPVISDIRIDIRVSDTDRKKLTGLARTLIQLKKGDRFSPEELEKSLHALRQSGRFEQIHADLEKRAGKATLVFVLTPFRLVRDIRIHGAFPLFEKDVSRVISLSPGDSFIDEGLKDQAQRLVDYLKSQGYPEPKADVAAEKNPKTGDWTIIIRLDKGKPMVLEGLVFNGNDSISTFWLKSRMGITPSIYRLYIPKRFIEKILKKDIDSLLDYYRGKGFFDCRISTRRETLPGEQIRVFIDIVEGPRYRISFKGNDAISSRKLKKRGFRFNQGNQGDSGLRKTAAAVRDVYRESGFADALVKFEDTTGAGAGFRDVAFTIEEGQRFSVVRVSIEGNAFLHDKTIRKEVLTRKKGLFRKGYFLGPVLKEDLDSIRALYQKNGFTHTRVRPDLHFDPEDKAVSVGLVIEENARTLVSEIHITGVDDTFRLSALKAIGLKAGKPFRDYMLRSDENTLSALLSEAGYPFVTVTGSASISEDQKSARVTYAVDKGPSATMGEVWFSGNFRTKDRLLRKTIGLSPGDPFSSAKMLKGQKSLRDMDIFDSVQFNPIGLKEKWEQISLLVGVEEKKPYSVEFSLGYETQKGVFFQSKAGDRNLWGLNKNGRIGFDISETGYRVESEILEPRLLGSQISMSTGFYAEEEQLFNQEFGTTVIGANVGFSHKPLWHITPALNLRFEERDQFGQSAINSDDDNAFSTRPLLALTPSLSFDTRDSFINPKKGIFTAVSADFSKGVVDSLDNFIKYRIESRAYVTPAERLTFAWAGRFGHIAPYGKSNQVADDQLFFLGGISDVRGVDENMLFFDTEDNPLGGRTSLFSSLEARIDLGGDFELPLFFDTGRLSSTPGEGESGTFRSSVGTGLRYHTPIGPIGFLYGKILDPREGEPSGRFHFSIGYTF
jgi:outer membrane protein insertion porin family